MDEVNCDSDDYLHVWYHDSTGAHEVCLANGGMRSFLDNAWLDKFSTGNNRVQYHSNGWEPAEPVEKYTLYEFKNHPGGVRFDSIRIV